MVVGTHHRRGRDRHARRAQKRCALFGMNIAGGAGGTGGLRPRRWGAGRLLLAAAAAACAGSGDRWRGSRRRCCGASSARSRSSSGGRFGCGRTTAPKSLGRGGRSAAALLRVLSAVSSVIGTTYGRCSRHVDLCWRGCCVLKALPLGDQARMTKLLGFFVGRNVDLRVLPPPLLVVVVLRPGYRHDR